MIIVSGGEKNKYDMISTKFDTRTELSYIAFKFIKRLEYIKK